MLSKEDQRRFDQITRQLRESDPAFFNRLDHRARARRGRYLMLLTIVLWASLPAIAVFDTITSAVSANGPSETSSSP
ncbi:DUF3040 domain-containing protein, partial [Micromonospora vinacea]|uniref:DUF3040 domain-containing protein n=1 Tax=Micromonospora vinacea TaxID=709878 RepID=UPI00344CCD25